MAVEFEDEGVSDCLKKQDCQYDEEGHIILCDDCPQKKAWEKMLENNPS